MSLFNDDQQDYMESLSRIPNEEKCWCGWYRLGDCISSSDCNKNHSGKTRADYLAVACPECFNLPPVHRIGCSQDTAGREGSDA